MSAARDRGRLVEALQPGPRLPLGQAGRSFVQRSDLRQPLRRRGRRRLQPHLVPRPPAERRLSRACCNALPGPSGGAFACRGQANPALHAAASTSPSSGASTSPQPTCREAALPDRRRSAFPHWRLYGSTAPGVSASTPLRYYRPRRLRDTVTTLKARRTARDSRMRIGRPTLKFAGGVAAAA
jgi:hypothetical protein